MTIKLGELSAEEDTYPRMLEMLVVQEELAEPVEAVVLVLVLVLALAEVLVEALAEVPVGVPEEESPRYQILLVESTEELELSYKEILKMLPLVTWVTINITK